MARSINSASCDSDAAPSFLLVADLRWRICGQRVNRGGGLGGLNSCTLLQILDYATDSPSRLIGRQVEI